MEKGEVAILSIQFGALILVVLLLSNFGSGVTNASSTPSIPKVYWGIPPPGNGTSIGQSTNHETVNASTMSFYYTLAPTTSLVTASASVFCVNPQNATASGDIIDYTNLTRHYDTSAKDFYFTFGPVGQPNGWSCVYSLSVTDSLGQVSTWVGTVIVKPPTP